MFWMLMMACGEKDDTASPDDTQVTDDTQVDDTGDTGQPAMPQVIEVFPEPGSTGNQPSEHVRFVFNKAMDPLTVNPNINLSGFVASDLRWNDDYTQLWVVPKEDIELLQVESVEDDGWQEFTVLLGADVADADGNTLGEPVSTTFTMARLLSVRTELKSELTNCVSSKGEFCEKDLVAGDTGKLNTWVALLTWDLSGIPSEALGLAGASLALDTQVYAGSPYKDLGGMRLERVSVDGLAGAYAALASADMEGSTEEGIDVLTVTELFQDEVAEMDGRGQLRVRFVDDHDGDEQADQVLIQAASLKLVVYIP